MKTVSLKLVQLAIPYSLVVLISNICLAQSALNKVERPPSQSSITDEIRLTVTVTNKAKQEIFDKRHGLDEKGNDLLSSFLDDVYLHWRSTMTKPNQILGARWISSHSIISATGTC